jgi:hypothetical protein
MKSNFFALAIFAASALIFSCSKKKDNGPADKTAPILVSHNIKDMFLAGDKLEFDLNFSDETELGEVKVEIHSNFDGHSHGRMEGAAFAFKKVYQLTGKTGNVKESMSIPSDALTGDYHFIVHFTDKAGNEGEEFEHDFEIGGKNQPIVAIQYPGQGVGLTRTFTPSGGMTAQNGLKEAVLRLSPISASGAVMNYLYEKKLVIADKPTSLGLNAFGEITLPASLAAGNYEFRVTVTDMAGNTKSAKNRVTLR